MPSPPPNAPWPHGGDGSQWIGGAPPRRSRRVLAIVGPIGVGLLIVFGLLGAWFLLIAFLFAGVLGNLGSNK
jgi:hypothetical protein